MSTTAVRRADVQHSLVLPQHHIRRDPLRLWQQSPLHHRPLFPSPRHLVLQHGCALLAQHLPLRAQQTLLNQLLVYLLSSGEVVAAVGILNNVRFQLFAGFNPPAAATPDRYRWLYDVALFPLDPRLARVRHLP
uniref:Uncharacterized protein n=1 Tax=Peronospora matthiolae TaxID=2874970 RepID=A0AAV1UKH4_9STRA